MIGIVYLGKNPNTRDKLKYVPGQIVRMTSTYKDAAKLCVPRVKNEHFIVFFERGVKTEDITSITYLKKKCPGLYIILLTAVKNIWDLRHGRMPPTAESGRAM